MKRRRRNLFEGEEVNENFSFPFQFWSGSSFFGRKGTVTVRKGIHFRVTKGSPFLLLTRWRNKEKELERTWTAFLKLSLSFLKIPFNFISIIWIHILSSLFHISSEIISESEGGEEEECLGGRKILHFLFWRIHEIIISTFEHSFRTVCHSPARHGFRIVIEDRDEGSSVFSFLLWPRILLPCENVKCWHGYVYSLSPFDMNCCGTYRLEKRTFLSLLLFIDSLRHKIREESGNEHEKEKKKGNKSVKTWKVFLLSTFLLKTDISRNLSSLHNQILRCVDTSDPPTDERTKGEGMEDHALEFPFPMCVYGSLSLPARFSVSRSLTRSSPSTHLTPFFLSILRFIRKTKQKRKEKKQKRKEESKEKVEELQEQFFKWFFLTIQVKSDSFLLLLSITSLSLLVLEQERESSPTSEVSHQKRFFSFSSFNTNLMEQDWKKFKNHFSELLEPFLICFLRGKGWSDAHRVSNDPQFNQDDYFNCFIFQSSFNNRKR